MPARWLIGAAMSAVAAALLAPPLLAQPEIGFAVSDVVVTEGQGGAALVTLTPASDTPVTVGYSNVQGPVPRATPGAACGGDTTRSTPRQRRPWASAAS